MFKHIWTSLLELSLELKKLYLIMRCSFNRGYLLFL